MNIPSVATFVATNNLHRQIVRRRGISIGAQYEPESEFKDCTSHNEEPVKVPTYTGDLKTTLIAKGTWRFDDKGEPSCGEAQCDTPVNPGDWVIAEFEHNPYLGNRVRYYLIAKDHCNVDRIRANNGTHLRVRMLYEVLMGTNKLSCTFIPGRAQKDRTWMKLAGSRLVAVRQLI